MEKAEAELAPIDILINNVGTLPHGMMPTPFLDTPEEMWKKHIDNNLYGTLNATRAVVGGMKQRGWGRVIAISSDAGRAGHYGSSVYGAAKAGMEGFMRTIAKEFGRSGVTANSIVLGLIDTVPEEFSKGAEKYFTVGRIGTPEDIAAAVATFRIEAPHVTRIVAFGNCDAATALAMFQERATVDALVLANPWVIENAADDTDEESPTAPSAAAIRARYWARIKNPRSLIDLFTGKIDLRKLVGGLAKASQREEASGLAVRLAKALGETDRPVQILMAKRDTTALAFFAAWKDTVFEEARSRENIRLTEYDSASHSFADAGAKAWLKTQIGDMLK